MSSDKQYIDQTFRRAVYLERLKQSMVNDFGLTLKQIDRLIGQLDIESLTAKQLDKYLDTLDKQLTKTLGVWSDNYREQLSEIFADCYEFEKQSLVKAYEVPATAIATPSNLAALSYVAMAKPLPLTGNTGIPLDDLIKDLNNNEVKRIKQAVRMGHFEGKTNQQLVQQIRGTRANKFKDGILQTTTRNAEAIVRTGVQQVANDARLEIAKQNSDIVIGEQIIATLDNKVSVICRSMDHRIFKVGEGRRPPFHINCRSTFILVLDPKYRGKGNTDKRASYEGVTDNKSYYEWLKSQTKTFQDDALGKTRAALFRDGGLSADDFARLNLNKNFEPLTLDEMRAKNPTAFEKAGI